MKNKLCWVCEKNEGGKEYSLCKQKHKHYKPCEECINRLGVIKDKIELTMEDHKFMFNYAKKVVERSDGHNG